MSARRHEHPRERHFPFAAQLQLSRMGCRSAGFEHWNLDAAHGAGLDCPDSAHPPQCDRGRHRDGASIWPAPALASLDRIRGRPSRPAPDLDDHSSRLGNSGSRSGYSDRDRSRSVVARICICISARLRHRLRLARKPDLRVGARRRSRLVERRGAELNLVQRGANDRSRGRGALDRFPGFRLGIPVERRLISGGALRTGLAAR
jgi:hypothetical protein